MQINKVTRIGCFGFKKVYSLVFNKQGCYVIYTGKPGGLPQAFAHLGTVHGGVSGVAKKTGAALGAQAATPLIAKFQEELAAGEQKITPAYVKTCLDDAKNSFIAFSDVKPVDAKGLKLVVVAGKKYKFTFLTQKDADVALKLFGGT